MVDTKYENTFEDPNLYADFGEKIGHWAIFKSELEKENIFKNVKSVVSIGAGEGRLESALASEHGVALGYIDPSKAFGEIYLKRLQDSNCEDKSLEFIQKTFQDAGPKCQYDLVLFIHSFYAFGYDKELIKKALALTTDNGRVFIGLAPKISANYLLAQITGELSGQTIYHEGMVEKLNRWGISHRHWTVPHRFAIETFLNRNQPTAKSESFIHFLIGTPFDKASKQVQKAVVETIHQHTKDGFFEIFQGCILIEK